MPETIDEVKFRDPQRTTFDVSNPRNPSTGIPTKAIPHMEYPRVIYKHPNKPTRTIVHRNDKYEVVGEEVVPTEHLAKTVNSKEELELAQKDGWKLEPYIPIVITPKEEDLYASAPVEKKSK